MYRVLSNKKNIKKDVSFPAFLRNFNPNHILVLTGKSSYKTSGAKEFLINELRDNYKRVHFYSDFENNPKIQDLNEAIEKLSSKDIKLIIACGGGSVIDFAKLLKIYLNKASFIKDFPNKYKIPEESNIMLVAIPTTAGTGSEATHFSVLYNNNVKHSIASHEMLPDYSVLNSSICLNADIRIKSSCIIDAFSQAIESYWSVNANDASIEFAKKSINLINKHIDHFNKNHDDKNVLSDVLYGAYYAGKAINISKTTGPHALSYSLTSLFNIPHGNAVGMTFGDFFLLNELSINKESMNCNSLDRHLAKMQELRELLGWGDPISCKERWDHLMKKLGLVMKIELNGNKKNTINKLVKMVNLERLNNNPMTLSEKNITQLYEGIFF